MISVSYMIRLLIFFFVLDLVTEYLADRLIFILLLYTRGLGLPEPC